MNWNVKGDLVTANIDGHQNVVIRVPWVCSASSNGVTVNMNGKTDLKYDSVSPFIQYQDLNEAEVISWVKYALGQDGVLFYESKTQKVLDQQLLDPERSGFLFESWATYFPVQNKSVPWNQG